MSERSTGSSRQDERADEGTDGAAGRPVPSESSGNGTRESAAERTTVISEPVHGRASGSSGSPGSPASSGGPVVAGDAAAPEVPAAPRSGVPRVPAGVPPWQRGGATESEQTIDVGRPQHGGDGIQASADAPTQRTYAFSEGPPPSRDEAPTGSVPLITDPVADDPPREGFDYEQPTVRTDQPMFENTAPAAARPSSQRVRSSRAPRRASLQLKRLDPWSVLKLSMVLSVAGFLVWMVAVGVLYGVLEGMGVWDQLNGTYSDLTSVGNPGAGGDLISAGRVFGVAAGVGVINILLFTALATVGSIIYNVSSDLAGGVELTLSERD